MQRSKQNSLAINYENTLNSQVRGRMWMCQEWYMVRVWYGMASPNGLFFVWLYMGVILKGPCALEGETIGRCHCRLF